MTANEIIAQQASDVIFLKGYTPDSVGLAIGIAPAVVRDLCDGTNVETSTVSVLSRALGVNLFQKVSEMIDKQLNK